MAVETQKSTYHHSYPSLHSSQWSGEAGLTYPKTLSPVGIHVYPPTNEDVVVVLDDVVGVVCWVVLEDVAGVVCCVVLDVDDETVAPVLTVVVVLDVDVAS